MQRKTILSALFFLISIYSFSQKRLIECTTQNNPDHSISINAVSFADADYTLRITFSNLVGYSSRSLYTSNIALAVVNRGSTEIMKLVPDDGPSHALQYKYQFFPGHSFAKIPDTSFQYLIPASVGKPVRVIAISSTISMISQKLGNEYRGTGFMYKLNDTICAARAGIVFEATDTVKTGENTDVIYKANRNRIHIEHRDGTIGGYGITAPIKLLVSIGDEVFPGQPLAVFNKESPRYMAFFSIYYLNEKKLLTENNPDNTVYYVYMPTYFYANENNKSSILERNQTYIVQQPREIISKEMTKKEKKKLGY